MSRPRKPTPSPSQSATVSAVSVAVLSDGAVSVLVTVALVVAGVRALIH